MHTAGLKTHTFMQKHETLGSLLYDADCPFCRKWILRLGHMLREHSFEIAPLQSPWVIQRLNLPNEDLLRDVRLLLPDGRQIIGADAYRYIMRQIGWVYPFYLLSLIPLLRTLIDASYRKIATNRYCLSSAVCRFPKLRGLNQNFYLFTKAKP
jgi:predicted DCC family thiol-disulfide oxidoreductase YuxK